MANTTNFGWETPDDTDLVKDGAAAIRTLGSAIDTSLADLEGGTTGQILAKNSNTDMDFIWVTNDVGDITEVVAGTGISGGGTSGSVTITNTVATEFDAKGDLVVGTGADTFDKLTVGANDTVLTADSSTATGLKWAAPAAAASFKGVSLYDTGSTQSISNATDTAVTFNAEGFDTDAFHSTSTNTSRVTIPAGMGGYYLVTCGSLWASNATGRRQTFVLKNGANDVVAKAGTIAGSSAGIIGSYGSAVVNLTAGDYIELFVQQSSGGSLDVYKRQEDSIFTVTYLGA